MSMEVLKINGTALAGIYVDASLSYNKPARRFETYEIPGRNGGLVIDDGTWDNLVITYPCYTKNIATFASLINQLGALSGYQKIECSNDTTHFRLGVPIIPATPTIRRRNTEAWFDLAFNCKPQRFLNTGETVSSKTSSGSISNPTAFASQPLLRIYGTGPITVNGTRITVAAHGESYVDVDCEMMDCYNGTTSLNSYVTFNKNDFPSLKPGSNTITFNSGTSVTKIEITPRWWEL